MIKALADEREVVQKKTFTKWVNSHLARVSCRISDLYLDLRDGRMLIKLLEVLSGERLPKPTKGRMRIHCLENVDKALQFLKEQRVHLENMGSHDIVDGNHRLVLGLIWTIILRFQIQDIIIQTQEGHETRSAKDALLLWCQMKTAGYPQVNVTNFTSCWKDGLAFNALIHRHRPDLIDFDKLQKSNARHNLENAFDVADKRLGITQLLDPEDVFTENPDEKSIITYVVSFYHYFSKMKALAVEGKRVGKVLDHALETEKMINQYGRLSSDLLKWIEKTILLLESRKFANSLTGVQQQLQSFSTYRTVEKPPKFQEKGNLEVLLFTIQSRMRSNNQKVYTPTDGKLVSDVNKAWEGLEKAEHERELALRQELIRQEKLEQLARRFDRKAAMRETWINENQHLVSQDNFGYDLPSVEAAKKKQDAIETDIAAYGERVQAIVDVAAELERERYHDVKRINARKDNILRLWDYLMELLKARRGRLDINLTLQRLFQEMLQIINWMDEMKGKLLSPEIGKHLLEVEDLLQKHALMEADIAAQADKVRSSNAAALKFANGDGYQPCDPQVIRDRVNHLELCYQELEALAAERKSHLEQSKRMWKFFWEMEEVERWIREKEHIYSSMDFGKDLTSILILQRKHSTFEDELRGLEAHLQQTAKEGERMIARRHFGTPKIRARIEEIMHMWAQLKELAAFREKNLRDAESYFQFQVDADELTVWLQDTYRIMSSNDLGHDEYSTQALVKKHKDLTGEVMNNGKVIENLIAQVESLPREFRDSPEIESRLKRLKEAYADVLSLAEQRRQRLQDALALYTVFSETDACELWMSEKEKWLQQMEILDELEDLEVIQHRFEILDQEMNSLAYRIDGVNRASQHLIESGHPGSLEVKQCQDHLNARWDRFRDMVAQKRKAVDSALALHNYFIDCDETRTWILEKNKVIVSTKDLGKDLAGVIAIQRKLYGIERDLAAIESKLANLQEDAHRLAQDRPSHAEEINNKLEDINSVWSDLQRTLQSQEASLGEASKLHKFLQDLDDLQAWLFKAQKDIASDDIPNSLPEAEKLLQKHLLIKDDINEHEDNYRSVMDMGGKVTYGQTDPQYQQLSQRLKGMDTGWKDLLKIWKSREKFLSQCLAFQQFLKDAKQAEAILSNQEYNLSHAEPPSTLEAAEAGIRKHEDFLSTMETNEEKITGTIVHGNKLIGDKNMYADKIKEKILSIEERYKANAGKSKAMSLLLTDNRDLQSFLQNCQELTFWINEKMLTAQDMSYDEAHNLHSKWLKHQAFMAELASNKGWLDKVEEEGNNLAAGKPKFKPIVTERLGELHRLWEELESTTNQKAQRLFDANRSELHAQSYADIKQWISQLEDELNSADYGKDLTSVNKLLNKHKRLEDQVSVRKLEVEELLSQAPPLPKEGLEHIDGKERDIEAKFVQLLEPLHTRRKKLQSSKALHQLHRDLADETLWVQERLPLAESTDHGHNLQTVQLLLKKNQTLQNEMTGHQPRIKDVLIRAEAMRAEPDVDFRDIDKQLSLLQELWSRLQAETSKRKKRLQEAQEAQQYYMDATDAEAWTCEQQLNMIGDEKPKDEECGISMLKRHLNLQQAIEHYGKDIKQLADQAQRILGLEHPEGEQIIRLQGQIDKQYAGLKDLAAERRQNLNNMYHMFQLKREVEDLEQWIAERDVVASSQEMGQDLDHVTLLRERFREFAKETGAVGQDRMDNVNLLIEELIDAGHSEAAAIAEWKDSLNESWADLLELIDTRMQFLSASYDLHKYFDDGGDLLILIKDKHKELPEEIGLDAYTVESFHRMHNAFEHDMHSMGTQVQRYQDVAARLKASYAGAQAVAIEEKEREVVDAWKALLDACEGRRGQLVTTAEKYRFFSMARDLMFWMESIIRQIETQEKPRDVSSVELLMKYHQGLKAEMEARNRNYASCVDLGNVLLARKHPASEEIKEKLGQIAEKRAEMMDKWDKRWDWLRLLLEVCQFARDASVAEAWLIAQESYLASRDYGNSVHDVEKLIKRHEAFEKSTATWEERFAALERLTTLELLEMRKHQEAARLKVAQGVDHDHEKSPGQGHQTHHQEEEDREEASVSGHQSHHSRQSTERPTRVTVDVETNLVTMSQSFEDLPVEIQGQVTTGHEEQAEESPRTVLHTPTSEIQESLTLPRQPESSHSIEMKGYLGRKHDFEGPTKKAANRSWNTLYCVLQRNELSFYKDAKSYDSSAPFHGEEPFTLASATCEAAGDYKKKKYVFRLRLNNGNQWLFHGKDEAETDNWIQMLTMAIASAHPQRMTQSLPLPSTPSADGKKEKEKRFSFFPPKK
ncbi:spectrin beta chain, erythrocytic isoform X2 [Ambystoma mexicanum]|uniref:spectrin beta chain, erythrocytic isoform X2 n=1 Tax=Ambystoma mexicanum TaxID=8296 RepID=UPI0037E97E90